MTERRFVRIVWRELKQGYRVRAKCDNLLNYLIIWIADDVNFSYSIAMAKEFGMCQFQPISLPL